MILPIPLPVLLGVAGAMVAIAGLLVITHHRHRALIPLGVLTVLAGITIAAPLALVDTTRTLAETARTALDATGGALTGLLHPTSPAEPAIIAGHTP